MLERPTRLLTKQSKIQEEINDVIDRLHLESVEYKQDPNEDGLVTITITGVPKNVETL